MKPEIYWLDHPQAGCLATMPRPRGGAWLATEIAELRHLGVDIIVSLLTQAEMFELDLRQEANYCEHEGITFISFPIPDFTVPVSMTAVRTLTSRLKIDLTQEKCVTIHCRMGIGRSSIIAAALLIHQGLGAVEALTLIETCRGLRVPDTQAQRDWVVLFEQMYLS